MALLTCLTGSYPPEHDINLLSSDLPEDSRESTIESAVRRAVADQVETGIDILVDGQIRDDIVAMFLPKLRGCVAEGADYVVTGRIGPSDEPITVRDFQYASELAPGYRFKAHVTGPISLARELLVATDEYQNQNDHKLIMDLSHAIAQEARSLADAGAEIIQIDEPALAHGGDLAIAFKAWQAIMDEGKLTTTWLHACGDVRPIFRCLVEKAPVDAISIQGDWLDDLSLRDIDHTYLEQHGKKLCYGCIEVDKQEIERLSVLQRVLGRVVDRFHVENIDAVTPNCGLRSMQYVVAKGKMKVMVEAARSIR